MPDKTVAQQGGSTAGWWQYGGGASPFGAEFAAGYRTDVLGLHRNPITGDWESQYQPAAAPDVSTNPLWLVGGGVAVLAVLALVMRKK